MASFSRLITYRHVVAYCLDSYLETFVWKIARYPDSESTVLYETDQR